MTESSLSREAQAAGLVFVMSNPVTDDTSWGILRTVSKTSPVSLAAPISPPVLIMVTFLACVNGAATSAAICYTVSHSKVRIFNPLPA